MEVGGQELVSDWFLNSNLFLLGINRLGCMKLQKNIRNEKGSVLIMTYMVLVCMAGFAAVFSQRTISEKNLSAMSVEQTKAFYLAEAGVDEALLSLRGDYDYYTGTPPTTVGEGEFETNVSYLSTTRRVVNAIGYFPDRYTPRAVRRIEAVIKKEMPADFFGDGVDGYAIWSAGDVDLNGTSYAIEGDVVYAGNLEGTDENVTGSVTQDPGIAPLARFDFDALRNIAIAQGNLYDSTRIKDIETGKDSYPDCAACPADKPDCCFWYTYPSVGMDGNLDPTTGVPNVNFIEGGLKVGGNTGTIGGFFIVVDGVLATPPVVEGSDTTFNGTLTIEGCIYSLQKFTIDGGGNSQNVVNINGGVWCETEAELNSGHVTYDGFKMEALQHLIMSQDAAGDAQLLSWREV